MPNPLAITEWLDELEAAMNEVASTAFGFKDIVVAERRLKVTDNMGGAYVSLTGDSDTIQLGLTSSPAGFQRIAKALLGMDPVEPDLAPQDMADSVCEVVNVLAGIVKRRIHSKVTRLSLGLPIFVRGGVQTTERMTLMSSRFAFGGTEASVLIIQAAAPRTESYAPLSRG